MLHLVPAALGGIPGGLEVLVILFVVFLLFGVPVALALFLGYRYVQERSREDRIEALENELDSLREQVEGTNHADSNTADATEDER